MLFSLALAENEHKSLVHQGDAFGVSVDSDVS